MHIETWADTCHEWAGKDLLIHDINKYIHKRRFG